MTFMVWVEPLLAKPEMKTSQIMIAKLEKFLLMSCSVNMEISTIRHFSER